MNMCGDCAAGDCGWCSYYDEEIQETCKCGATTGPCFCRYLVQGWEDEEQKSASCVEIDVHNDLQEPRLLSRIIWQELFNLYQQNGGDLSKMDSLLCDLYTLEHQLQNCLKWWREDIPDMSNVLHVQWSFDPCGLTWINTQYCPESDFNYWIDWSGKRDEPIVIKRITHEGKENV